MEDEENLNAVQDPIAEKEKEVIASSTPETIDPKIEYVDYNKDPEKNPLKELDYFETRMKDPNTSVENLFYLYGADGFKSNFKSEEAYWEDKNIQDKFIGAFGIGAKHEFSKVYKNSLKEYSNYQMGKFKKSVSGFELVSDDLSALKSSFKLQHTNSVGSVKLGKDWGPETKDYRENFDKIKIKTFDENGKETYKIVDYSPELLETLKQDASFSGLAYSDLFYGFDKRAPTDGFFYDAIYDGKIQDFNTGELIDVRNDQVVSQWDLDTDSIFDGLLKNNKLEAEGFFDYAKILVKAPLNMAVNLLDTVVQLSRAGIAGGYGLANAVTQGATPLSESETYRYLTNMGIKFKGYNTSLSREAMEDGFFQSKEAFLTTTADVILQVALAGALGRAGAGLVGLRTKKLSETAIRKAQQRYAEVTVRTTLTALAAKDSYNDAIERGFTTTEASLITGAMGAALWKATAYASYLFGDYEVKNIRKAISEVLRKKELKAFETVSNHLKKEILEETVEKTASEVVKKKFIEKQAELAMSMAQRVVDKVFVPLFKSLPPSKWMYAMRQEGIEEMTEELFQDGVKHGASAYGALMKAATGRKQGRYSTIFDDGYFVDAVERYATSGVAGAIGGAVGISMSGRVNVSPITSTSSILDVILAGKKSELVEVLDEMKANGELGPTNLSIEYDTDLEAFLPITEGSDTESLSDMVYNTYLHDINVIETFANMGLINQARTIMELDPGLKEFVEENSMRDDLATYMGNMLDFHINKGISTSILPELDALTDFELANKIQPTLDKIKGAYIAVKQKELDDLLAKKEAGPDKESDTDKKEGTNKEPKTEKKEKTESIEKNNASKVDRLKAEIALSKNVNKDDLIELLENYRRIRAIAKGVAAEDYIIQNGLANDPVLGSRNRRSPEYLELGKHPMKDILFSMRARAIKDEQIHIKKEIASKEIEEKVLSIKESDMENEDSVNIILDIFKNDPTKITEKAIKHLIKLRENVKFTEAQKLFDPTNEKSIFKKLADGTVSKDDMDDMYIDILKLDSSNNTAISEGLASFIKKEDNKDSEDFFKALSKDPKKTLIPIYAVKYIHDIEDAGVDSINKVAKKFFSVPVLDVVVSFFKAAEAETLINHKIYDGFAADGQHKLDLRYKTIGLNTKLVTGDFFTPDSYKRRNINALFNDQYGSVITDETLLYKGMTEVNKLIASGSDGIYSKDDYGKVDEILKKVAIREAVAKALNKYTTKDPRKGDYINMLATFRKNTLNIIDFKYDPTADPNTDIEKHPYKDHTVFSDFFTDFMFDPVLYSNAIATPAEARTEQDKRVMRHHTESILQVSDIAYDENGVPHEVTIDTLALEDYLNTRFDNLLNTSDLEDAVEFFNSDENRISVPSNVVLETKKKTEEVDIRFDGMTKLKASKWLLRRAKEIMLNVNGKNAKLPYIKHKELDTKNTFDTYQDLLNNPKFKVIKDYIDDNDDKFPEYKIVMSTRDPDMIMVAQLNIKLEKLLYDIYNKNVILTNVEAANINALIDTYISELNANNGSQAYDSELQSSDVKSSFYTRRITTLIGAITTDFSLFYSRYKRDLLALDHTDNASKVAIAGQEFSAKYTAAYIYSNKFSKYVNFLNKDRNYNDNYIDTIYISGTYGSGKTSATINLGVKLGVEIMESMGSTNTASLAVSNHGKQVDNLMNSIGDLSQGIPGRTVKALDKLLIAAIYEGKDSGAFKEVAKIGPIIMDEITYVTAMEVADQGEPILKRINKNIRAFNRMIPGNKHGIKLIVMGDPLQSNVGFPFAGALFPTSINRRSTHYLPYMDFSFRIRNDYSLDALSKVETSIKNRRSNTDKTILTEGTKYGTLNGKYYGANIIDEADKSGDALISQEFIDVLNDEEITSNIEKNIKDYLEKKRAYDNNEEGAESPEPFNVIIAPGSVDEFNSGSTSGTTKMSKLMAIPEYKPFFTLIASQDIGGSEASYVIGEFTIDKNLIGLEGVGGGAVIPKGLTTFMTRSFDYTIMVNRVKDFVVRPDRKSVQSPDGQVIIPNRKDDSVMKDSVRNYYVKILDGIEESAEGTGTTPTPAPGGTGGGTGPGSGGNPPGGTGGGGNPVVEDDGPSSIIPTSDAHLSQIIKEKFIDPKNGILNTTKIINNIDTLDSSSLIALSNGFTKLVELYGYDVINEADIDIALTTIMEGYQANDIEAYNAFVDLTSYIFASLQSNNLTRNPLLTAILEYAKQAYSRHEILRSDNEGMDITFTELLFENHNELFIKTDSRSAKFINEYLANIRDPSLALDFAFLAENKEELYNFLFVDDYSDKLSDEETENIIAVLDALFNYYYYSTNIPREKMDAEEGHNEVELIMSELSMDLLHNYTILELENVYQALENGDLESTALKDSTTEIIEPLVKKYTKKSGKKKAIVILSIVIQRKHYEDVEALELEKNLMLEQEEIILAERKAAEEQKVIDEKNARDKALEKSTNDIKVLTEQLEEIEESIKNTTDKTLLKKLKRERTNKKAMLTRRKNKAQKDAEAKLEANRLAKIERQADLDKFVAEQKEKRKELDAKIKQIQEAAKDSQLIFEFPTDKEKKTSTVTTMISLLNKLNIPHQPGKKAELFREIQKRDVELVNKIQRDGLDAHQEEVDDMMAIKEHWHDLYTNSRNLFPSDSYGDGFYINKFIDHKETELDYKNRMDKIVAKEELYTVPLNITGYFQTVILPMVTRSLKLGDNYIALNRGEGLDAVFNFSGNNKESLPTSLELRVIRQNNGVVNVFLVAVKGKDKYIVSQIDTSYSGIRGSLAGKIGNLFKKLRAETSESIKKDLSLQIEEARAALKKHEENYNEKLSEFVAGFNEALNDPRRAVKINEGKNVYTIVDIPLKSKPRDVVKVRAGSIITLAEDSPGKMVTDLREQGLVIPKVAYVVTKKDLKTGKQKVGGVNGEMFTVFSLDKASSMDTKSITKKVQEGSVLGTGNFIINEGINVDVQLGVLPLKIANDMNELSIAVRNNPGLKFGEMPSHLSIALQSYIIEYITNFIGQDLNKEVANRFKNMSLNFVQPGRKDQRLVITKEHVGMFSKVSEGLAKYMANKAELDADSKAEKTFKQTMQEVLAKLKDPKNKTLVDNIASAYIHATIVGDMPNTENPFRHLISPYKDTGAYSFAINAFLQNGYGSKVALDMFSQLADLTNYSLKLNIEKGDTAYAAVVNNKYVEALDHLLVAKIEGVEEPVIVFKEHGTKEIRRTIKDYGKVDITEDIKTSEFRIISNIVNNILADDSVKTLLSLSPTAIELDLMTIEKFINILAKDPNYKNTENTFKLAAEKLSKYKEIIISNKLSKEGSLPGDFMPNFVGLTSYGTEYDEHRKIVKNMISTVLLDFDMVDKNEKEEILQIFFTYLKNDSSINIAEKDFNGVAKLDSFKELLIEGIISFTGENEALVTLLEEC